MPELRPFRTRLDPRMCVENRAENRSPKTWNRAEIRAEKRPNVENPYKKAYASAMDTMFYSTGQAARTLGITQDRVRQLCEAGAVTADVTNGGQWRVPKAEIDRLKRDGLPPVPRPLPGDSVRRMKSSNGLLAPPSPAVVSAAEDLAITENLLRRRRLELELAQVEDEFAERERIESEQSEAEEREEQARID